MESLADKVRRLVSVRAYYDKAVTEKIRWPDPNSSTQPRINCLFHADKNTPSLHIEPKTGKWYCHGCEAAGNSIISFHAMLNGLTHQEAAEALYAEYVRPIIPDRIINDYHDNLMNTPTAMNYLERQRGIAYHVIKQYKLGFHNERITFPIRDEQGLWINMKLYDPLYGRHNGRNFKTPKMLNFTRKGESRSFGSPATFYPLSVLMNPDFKTIVLCEGELDTLLLLSFSIHAVTMTGGVKSWDKDNTEWFRGKEVIVAYDNDTEGNDWTKKLVVTKLKNLALSIRRLEIPTMIGDNTSKDVTNWWEHDPHMRNRKAWLDEINRSTPIITNDPEAIRKLNTEFVPISRITESRLQNQRMRTEGIIIGKGTAPYALPEKFRVTCNRDCDSCPLKDFPGEFKEKEVSCGDPRIMGLLDQSSATVNRKLLEMCGMRDSPGCDCKVEITKWFNLEKVRVGSLITGNPSYDPTVDGSGQYVTNEAYCVGHGIKPNRSYQFEGIGTIDPNDQHATNLFDVYIPMESQVETFIMTPEITKSLQVFRPIGNKRLMAHLMEIASWQSEQITHIVERPDLHITIDLVYHSVRGFRFNGELVKKGKLDVLVLGDTRCGKTNVAESLARYYGLGEVVSAESATFAGIFGGLQQDGKRWLNTWGVIPLNHDRLVVIDEASSFSEAEFAKFSRIRSEGVAEQTKIIREKVPASTRILWLANPRSGRPLGTYTHGVTAIKELVGANEDISRFDFALTVACNEVPSDRINVIKDKAERNGQKPKMPSGELCQNLILWAWSRTPDQIKFTREAEIEIIDQSGSLGQKYSEAIPLVQAANIRIKIAKVAAAVAARVFSSDESGDVVIVNQDHVRCACDFMNMVYSKGSMGYDTYSTREYSTEKPIDEADVKTSKDLIYAAFSKMGDHRDEAIEGFHHSSIWTMETIGDYVGDDTLAKQLLGELVRLNCLRRNGNYFNPKPNFTLWLRTEKEMNNARQPNTSKATKAPGVNNRRRATGDHGDRAVPD